MLEIVSESFEDIVTRELPELVAVGAQIIRAAEAEVAPFGADYLENAPQNALTDIVCGGGEDDHSPPGPEVPLPDPKPEPNPFISL